MKNYHLNTPKGTKDILFEECQARRWIEKKLHQVYTGYGYSEVITPGIEFLDVFFQNINNNGSENMYKLIDSEGRILVLRPDSTAPIARLVSTRLKQSIRPLRLYYNQNVYLQKGLYSGKSSETSQMGVELIGANTNRADLEIISMAAEALQQCDIEEYRLEIGHSGFFNALIGQLPFDEEQKEEVRQLIGAKNYAALNDLLDAFPASEGINALKQLPRLFGGEEVFAAAESIFQDAQAKRILDYLHWIYDALMEMGLKDSVMLDLGLVNNNDYYTGVIFQGYVQGSGEVILAGGRYDQLLGQFGESMPAIGFGINVDILTKMRLNKSVNTKIDLPVILVHGEPGYEVLCLQYAQTLRCQPGLIVENALTMDRQACLNYAKERGIQKIHFVGQRIEIIEIAAQGGSHQ